MTLEDAIKHAKEVARENRYRIKHVPFHNNDIDEINACIECAEEHEQLAIWLAELKRYKELKENGRLIELPCAVGDTVYTNYAIRGWYFRKGDRPYPAKVVFIGLNNSEEMGGGLFHIVYGRNNNMLPFNFSDIGKNVFLTKEEAEAKLKEAGEQNE